jgi:hypothetical protein
VRQDHLGEFGSWSRLKQHSQEVTVYSEFVPKEPGATWLRRSAAKPGGNQSWQNSDSVGFAVADYSRLTTHAWVEILIQRLSVAPPPRCEFLRLQVQLALYSWDLSYHSTHWRPTMATVTEEAKQSHEQNRSR